MNMIVYYNLLILPVQQQNDVLQNLPCRNILQRHVQIHLLNQAAQDPIVHDQKHQSNHTAPTEPG